MAKLVMAPHQPFSEVLSYFNDRISSDIKRPISPFSEGNSYIYAYFVPQLSTRNDAANALNILLDHWIVKFGIPGILVIDNGNKYINGKFTYFCRVDNVQFKARTPYAPWSNGLVENSNRQLTTFLRTVLDSQFDAWSKRKKLSLLHSTHELEQI